MPECFTVKGSACEFTLEASVHHVAKVVQVEITSREIAQQCMTLRDARQRLAYLREEWDRMRVALNEQEGLVDKLETNLRLEGLRQRGEVP
jgi:hypothetical protein